MPDRMCTKRSHNAEHEAIRLQRTMVILIVIGVIPHHFVEEDLGFPS